MQTPPPNLPGWMVPLAVAVGGACGALARYGIIQLVHGDGLRHPAWAIFLVNAIGCLAIGLIIGWTRARGDLPDQWQAIIAVGLLGSLTTFSTFAADAIKYIDAGRHLAAAVYVVGSVLAGLALAAGGWWVASSAFARS